jgi:hypothetical protein
MSNKFLGSALNNDYARESTLENIEDTLSNNVLKVNIVSGGGGGGGDMNLTEINSNPVNVNIGNSSSGTLRIVNATDDPNLSNINLNCGLINTNTNNIRSNTQLIASDTTILSDGVNNNKYDTNQISILGNNISVNSGNNDSGTQRICIATNDVNISNMNNNINDMAIDISNIDSNITNINTTVDTNQLKKIVSSDRYYVYSEQFPISTSKMTQVPTETEYIGWDINNAGGSRILMTNENLNSFSRYLVWETTNMYENFGGANPGQQSEISILGNSSTNNNTVTRFCIDGFGGNLNVVVSQTRIASGTVLNSVNDSEFNIDILDGNGISGINVKTFNQKYTFRTIVDRSVNNVYFQIFSQRLKRFSTFHVFSKNNFGDLDMACSAQEIDALYINQTGPTGHFYVENFSVYVTEKIDIDISNLEKFNINQIKNNEVPLLSFKKLFAYDDDLNSGYKIIGSNDNGSYDLGLIENSLGVPCSIVTDNNTLLLNYDVEIRYYQTSTTNIITTENISLNGHTPVNLANNVYRVISMRKLSSAVTSGGGNIFIYITADGSTNGIPDDDPIYFMQVDFKNSLISQLYVPPNRKVFLREFNILQKITDDEDAIITLFNYFDNSNLDEIKYDIILPIKGNIKIDDLNLDYVGPLTLQFKVQVPNQTNTNALSMTLNYIEKKMI